MELVAPAVEKFQAVADAQPLFVPVLVALLVVALALAAASMVEPKGKKKSKKSAGGGAPFTPGSRRSTRCVRRPPSPPRRPPSLPRAPLPARAGWDGKKLDAERGSSSPFKAPGGAQAPAGGRRAAGGGLGPPSGDPGSPGTPLGRDHVSVRPDLLLRPRRAAAAAGVRNRRGLGLVPGGGGMATPGRCGARGGCSRGWRSFLPRPAAAPGAGGPGRPAERGRGRRGARTPDSNGGSSTTSLLRPPVPRSR